MLRTLIDFTLSNARRFYSSMRNPLDGKGLTMDAIRSVRILMAVNCSSVKISPCCSDMRRLFLFCRCYSNLPFTFSDIDECNSTKPFTPCDQICENIPGSYNCSCEDGFNLVNGSRCEGIVTILLMFLQTILTGA